jgi:hypothetical protein
MSEFNAPSTTRLTALMAGHGLTFMQVYNFYMDIAQAVLHPHLRAQVVVFMAAMVIGIATAYLALAIPDTRPKLRRSLEILSAAILLSEWLVLGNAFLNMR